MQNYKNRAYTIRAKYAIATGGGSGEKSWNENLGVLLLPDNTNPDRLNEYAGVIIDSFKNLLADETAYDPAKQTLEMVPVGINELEELIQEDPTAGIEIGSDTVRFSISIETTNQLSQKNTVKLPGYFSSNIDSDTVPLIDTLARGLNNLTTRNYLETYVSATIYPLEV